VSIRHSNMSGQNDKSRDFYEMLHLKKKKSYFFAQEKWKSHCRKCENYVGVDSDYHNWSCWEITARKQTVKHAWAVATGPHGLALNDDDDVDDDKQSFVIQ